jgi:amidohydrolase
MIAQAGGATAQVHIHRWYDVTVNHPSSPSGRAHARAHRRRGNVRVIDKVCGAEDFSFYQKEVPGLLLLPRLHAADRDARTAAPNHSPRFYVDESCLPLGVKSLATLALDWLAAQRS